MALLDAESRAEPNTIDRPSGLARRGLVAVALAAIANALLRTGSVAIDPTLASVRPFGWAPILGSSVVTAVGATVVYWALIRRTARPNRNFVVIASAVLLVSFVPVVVAAPAIPGMTTAGVLALGVMHAVSALVIVGALMGTIGR